MLNLSKIQAITLDLDDTLWPVGPTIQHAEKTLHDWLLAHAPQTAVYCQPSEVKHQVRAHVQAQHADRLHDLSFLRQEAIRESLRRAGDDPRLAEDAFAVFFQARQQVTFFDGVHEALARLAARYPLVAVSNGNADVFRTAAGVHFHASVSARDTGVAKPDPLIFHAAAQRLSIAPDAVLHVGDDALADAVGALRSGMQAVWVNPEGHAWSHAEPQPLTVRHIADLCDHLLA
jgi:putative hydrolase of the HAD superfamily